LGIRVRNTKGKWSLTETKQIKVCTKDGPVSKMTYYAEGNKVFFENTSSNADSTLWKFGDNTTDTVLNPIKAYGRAGNFNLELISKNICASDTLREVVRINGIVSANATKSGNDGVATLIITGNGFTPSTPIQLQKGSKVILPSGSQFVASDRFIGYFDLAGAEEGFYNIVANLGGGSFDTLKNGFQVVPAVYPYVMNVRGGRSNGLKILNNLDKFKDYQKSRDKLTYKTTFLAAHNHFTTVSIREVYHKILKVNKKYLIHI
jgi:hypothetical protein